MSARERRDLEDDDGGSDVPSSSISRTRDDGLDDSDDDPSTGASSGIGGSIPGAPSGGSGGGGRDRDDDDDDDRVRGGTAGGGRGPRFDDDPSPAPEPDPEPQTRTETFRADTEASRRVGGSGDPTDSDTRIDAFDADQGASRRVGGSGDPTDEPEPDTVDVGGAADSGQGPRVGISDQSPFRDVRATAQLDTQTVTDLTPDDVQIEGDRATLTSDAVAAERDALEAAQQEQRQQQQTERFGDLDFSAGLGDPEVDEVERFVDSLPERADQTFRGPSERVFLPDSPEQRAGRTGSARALDALGFERAADRAEEGVREFGSELLPQTASGIASVPGAGLEAAEFAVTRENADELPDAARSAAASQVEAAQQNPARFGAGVVGGAAVGAGLSRGLRVSRGRGTGSATRSAGRSLDDRLSDLRERVPEVEVTRDPTVGPLDLNPDVRDAIRDRLPDTPSGPSNAPAGESLSDIFGTAGQPRVGRAVRTGPDVDVELPDSPITNAPAGESLSDIFGVAGRTQGPRASVDTPRLNLRERLPSNQPAGETPSDIFGLASRPAGQQLNLDLSMPDVRSVGTATADDSLSDIFGVAGRGPGPSGQTLSDVDLRSRLPSNQPAGDTPSDIFGLASEGPGPDGRRLTDLFDRDTADGGGLSFDVPLPDNRPAGDTPSDIFGLAGSPPDLAFGRRFTPTLRIGGGRRRGRGDADSDVDVDVDTPDDTPAPIEVDVDADTGGAGGTGQLTSLRMRGDSDTDIDTRVRTPDRRRLRESLPDVAAGAAGIGLATANDPTGIADTTPGVSDLDVAVPGTDDAGILGEDSGTGLDNPTTPTQQTPGATQTTGTGQPTTTTTTTTTTPRLTPATPTTTTTPTPTPTEEPPRRLRTPRPRLPEFDAPADDLAAFETAVNSADIVNPTQTLDEVGDDIRRLTSAGGSRGP